jgi:GAF domain-containing protein
VEIPEEVRLADALTKLALSLLNERSLKSDLERLARVGCELIPECSGASVSMVVEGETSTVAVTDRVSLQLDLIQYDNNEGPCVAALGGEAVRIGFIPADQRFPHFAIGAADRRVLSVLSTPAIDHGKVVGSLNVYSQVEDAFDDEARHTALIIAAEVANALVKSAVLSEASSLRDQLQEQHDSAALVSMAQGVLMATHDCSKAQAHDLITSAAEANNERIVTVAERILSTIDRNERPASEGRSTAVDN